MSILANLLALLSLDNSAYLQGIESSQNVTESFTGGLAAVGGAVVVGGLTAAATAVAAIGAAAWDAGNVVDGAMDTIRVATGATEEELIGLRKDFEVVFASAPADAEAAAGVIGVLNSRLDASGPALQQVAVPLLEVTRLLGGDAVANAENFTRVIGDWNIPLEQANASLDTLFAASQRTGAPLDRLMERIVQYGAPLRGFGLGFEQSAALLAKWEAEGANVETVLAGMRIAAGKFTKDGKDMAAGLWDTVDAITNAEDSTQALSIATEVFGSKAAVDMVDTIRSGKFDIDALAASLKNADGAVMDAARSTADWGEKWTQFKNKITVALAPIGEGMMDAAGSALEQVAAIFERPEVQQGVTTFANYAVQGITAIVTHIPTLINGLLAFVTFLQQNEGIVVGILAALGYAALTWGATTAAAAWTALAPMLPVIAVLALVALGAYLLYEAWTNNWGGIQQKVMPIIDNLLNGLNVAWVWMSTVLWPFLVQLGQTISTNIGAALAWMSELWTNTLLPAMLAVYAWISTNLFPLFIALAEFWRAVFNVALTALAGLFQNVLAPGLSLVGYWMKEKIWPIFKVFGNFIKETLSPALETFGGFLGGQLVDAFEAIADGIEKVIGFIQEMTDALMNLDLPDWLTPGSPTPWEIGLGGINREMERLAESNLPRLSAKLDLEPSNVPGITTADGVDAPRAEGPIIVQLDGNTPLDLEQLAYRVAEIVQARRAATA